MERRSVRCSAALLAVAACLVAVNARSFDRNADREIWQPPERIMDVAGVRAGMKIGEAGAGEGYLTFHLANRVGNAGTVYANEISEADLETIRDRARREGVENIVTDRPVEFLKILERYLKSGAPVVIVEKNTDTDRSYAPQFMSERQILETIVESGFEVERRETSLLRDTIYIYRVGR